MTQSENLRRIGALLTVGIRGSVPGDPQLEEDLDACLQAGVGGVIVFDVDVPKYRTAVAAGVHPSEARWQAERNVRSPGQLTSLIGYLRQRLGSDLLVMVDQEGGRVARLHRERGFTATLPSAEDFGQLSGPEQQAAARRQAVELAGLGFDLNLAPVVDVAVDPEAVLVSQQRVYSADPRRVLGAARTVIDAHAAVGLATCAKHFPGLGSLRLDTHETAATLGSAGHRPVELEPWRALMSGPRPPEVVMAAHVVWPEVDGERVVSQSAAALQGVLRDELGFEGVIATDSLDMAGARTADGPAGAAVASLRAGADLLIHAANLDPHEFDDGHPAPRIAAALAEAVDEGRLDGGWPEIDRRVARVRALRARPGAR